MFYFHPIRSKELPILNISTLSLPKYFYKMAATAGLSCGELGMKTRIVEFFRVCHEIIGWKNWIVRTPTFNVIHTKILSDNWTEFDRVN